MRARTRWVGEQCECGYILRFEFYEGKKLLYSWQAPKRHKHWSEETRKLAQKYFQP